MVNLVSVQSKNSLGPPHGRDRCLVWFHHIDRCSGRRERIYSANLKNLITLLKYCSNAFILSFAGLSKGKRASEIWTLTRYTEDQTDRRNLPNEHV